MYLLDTNVVSELRRPRPHPAVVAWFEQEDEARLFLPAVTIGEIQAGIERTREQDKTKAATLERWLDALAANHKILPMDAESFRLWAKIKHRRSDTLIEDAMIGAIAIQHGLIVATRNVRDFDILGVPTFNPFAPSP